MHALLVTNLEFSVKKKKILKSISFQVEKGSVFAIVGHNGAGKTTLFHLILGLKVQNSGELLLDGKSNLNHHSRERLGYVPERPYLNLDYDFREMLSMHANLLGMTHAKIDSEVLRVATEVGLQAHLDFRLSTFSKGMLQKSLLAQAMLGNPEILILDEPMSGLDPESREAVRNLISRLKAQGKTLIFSSHALEDVAELSDHVLILKDGLIEFNGSVNDWQKSRGHS